MIANGSARNPVRYPSVGVLNRRWQDKSHFAVFGLLAALYVNLPYASYQYLHGQGASYTCPDKHACVEAKLMTEKSV